MRTLTFDQAIELLKTRIVNMGAVNKDFCAKLGSVEPDPASQLWYNRGIVHGYKAALIVLAMVTREDSNENTDA